MPELAKKEVRILLHYLRNILIIKGNCDFIIYWREAGICVDSSELKITSINLLLMGPFSPAKDYFRNEECNAPTKNSKQLRH